MAVLRSPLRSPFRNAVYSPLDGPRGAAVPSLYLGQVATRCFIPSSSSAGALQFNSRSPHFARDAITSLQVLFPNWKCQQTTLTEGGTGGTATYTASVEYPSGTFTQVLFSGASSSGAMTDNTQLLSDVVAVAIPKNALFWVRIYAVFSVAGLFVATVSAVQPPRDATNGQLFEFAASGITDKTLGGTIPQTSGSLFFTPLAIVAQTRVPSVFVHGDSRAWHYQDTMDASGDSGEVCRSVGPYFGYINTSVYGDAVQTQNGNGFAKRGALALYCSHVISEAGTNDICALTLSAAQLRNRKSVLFPLYFAGKRIFETTITPQTTSTDSFATVANQTLRANATQIAVYNDLLRAGPLAGVTGYFEVANAVESSLNSGKWQVDGTANKYTADGTHGNQFANLAIKNGGGINPALITRAGL